MLLIAHQLGHKVTDSDTPVVEATRTQRYFNIIGVGMMAGLTWMLTPFLSR